MAKRSDIEEFDKIYENATKPKAKIEIGIGAKEKSKNEDVTDEMMGEEAEQAEQEEQPILDMNSLIDILSNSDSFEEFKSTILSKLGK